MANFTQFISSITQAEGGYQSDPNDTGNYNSLGELVGANHGISAKFYEGITKVIPSVSTMKSISKNQALTWFKKHFWDKVQADKIKSQAVAEMMADHAINAGVSSAVKIAQQTAVEMGKNISVDSVIGPNTLNAINALNPSQFVQKYADKRIAYYTSLNQSHWINGWINRVNKLLDKYKVQLTTNQHLIGWGLFLLAISGYYYYTNQKTPK